MHFPSRFTLPLLALVLAGACDDRLVAPNDGGTHAVGILQWEARAATAALSSGRPPVTGAPRSGVTAPDTVLAGVPFTAVITTVGPTICWQAFGADMVLRVAEADVTPIDFTPEAAWMACGDALVELPRPVELVFRQRGEAVLRVHGRRVVGANFASDERVVLEKRIVVL